MVPLYFELFSVIKIGISQTSNYFAKKKCQFRIRARIVHPRLSRPQFLQVLFQCQWFCWRKLPLSASYLHRAEGKGCTVPGHVLAVTFNFVFKTNKYTNVKQFSWAINYVWDICSGKNNWTVSIHLQMFQRGCSSCIVLKYKKGKNLHIFMAEQFQLW